MIGMSTSPEITGTEIYSCGRRIWPRMFVATTFLDGLLNSLAVFAAD